MRMGSIAVNQPAASTKDYADQREAQRFAQMLRGVKLICPQGEYLGILRDISATGLRLQLFHPFPDAEGYLLELGNEMRFAIEPRWVEGGYAGFSFVDAPVDVAILIAEASPFPKRLLRLRLRHPVMIRSGAIVSLAESQNISQRGARIACDRTLALRQLMRLDIQGIGAIPAKLRWRRNGEYGVVFEEIFRFDELARAGHALQARLGIPQNEKAFRSEGE